MDVLSLSMVHCNIAVSDVTCHSLMVCTCAIGNCSVLSIHGNCWVADSVVTVSEASGVLLCYWQGI